MRKVAVCLLSGGLDSCVAATYAKTQGYNIYTLSIDYGQTLKKELVNARKIACILDAVEHKTIEIKGFNEICQCAITAHASIPEDRDIARKSVEIPATYPPCRDPAFLLLACAWAESLLLKNLQEISDAKVIIGTNRYDSETYPDCKPETYKRLNELLETSTKSGIQHRKYVQIIAPLIDKTKSEVVKFGMMIGAPLNLTWSCYKGKEKACGNCDACKLRLQAFEDAGLSDPVEYEL
ncbi:MAG: 7-cyano-7-deazaguanine synthase QueC [Candidatus Aenigmatarchaeota archaeon]